MRRRAQDRCSAATPLRRTPAHRSTALDPVVLVPGFMAGDGTLRAMSRYLRSLGFRTYRSQIQANVGCTREAADGARATHRGDRDQARPQGHHRRAQPRRDAGPRPRRAAGPTWSTASSRMGSPMLAPGATHPILLLRRRDARPGSAGRLRRDDGRGLHRPASAPGRAGSERKLPLDPERGVHRDLLPARRHRRLAGCLDPQARHRRGPHQPRRHGVRPGRDGQRAPRRCATHRLDGRASRRPGAAVPDARWVRSASRAGDAGDLDRRRRTSEPHPVVVERARGPACRTRPSRRAGASGRGHERVTGADGVDDVDRRAPARSPRPLGEGGRARRRRG